MKIKLFDYHTHTIEHGFNKPQRIEETVRMAIERGYENICLTDHYPLPVGFFDPTPEKDCAMKSDIYPEYIEKVRGIQKKYKNEITVLIGAELDWLPEYESWTKKQNEIYKFDYVIEMSH